MDRDRLWKSVKRVAADRTRGWREKPVRKRPPMPIGEFVEAAMLPDAPRVRAQADAVRRVLGRVYGLPAESLHPDDRVAELRELTGKDCDLFEVVMLAESELGRTPGSATLPGVWQPDTVGDVVRAVVRALGGE